MHREYIRHEHLRGILNEMEFSEDVPDETFELLFGEFEHSSLIIAGDLISDDECMLTVDLDGGSYALLFTDMDEFRKAIAPGESVAQDNLFGIYKLLLPKLDLDGFILNIQSEGFIFRNEMFELIDYMPIIKSSSAEPYTTFELKQIRDSINNESIEAFVENPNNIGRYEELFEEMSNSTMLTMVLSDMDLLPEGHDGVIETEEAGSHGFLHMETLGGTYVAIYTSEAKMANIDTPLNKFSQVINPALITYFVLNNDMDGLIINPNSDDVLITREVLLEYSRLIQLTCNDPKLSTGMRHMFAVEEEA